MFKQTSGLLGVLWRCSQPHCHQDCQSSPASQSHQQDTKYWADRSLHCLFTMSGMRILVMLLLDTLPMLGNVLLLCFFVFFIFGIMGVQMWAGLLRQRCYISQEYQNNLIYQEGYQK